MKLPIMGSKLYYLIVISNNTNNHLGMSLRMYLKLVSPHSSVSQF